jgi:hypothetical protein
MTQTEEVLHFYMQSVTCHIARSLFEGISFATSEVEFSRVMGFRTGVFSALHDLYGWSALFGWQQAFCHSLHND